MSKEEAINQMRRGKKITHTYFLSDEWMTIKNGKKDIDWIDINEFEPTKNGKYLVKTDWNREFEANYYNDLGIFYDEHNFEIGWIDSEDGFKEIITHYIMKDTVEFVSLIDAVNII